jgi:hypothetical protein
MAILTPHVDGVMRKAVSSEKINSTMDPHKPLHTNNTPLVKFISSEGVPNSWVNGTGDVNGVDPAMVL